MSPEKISSIISLIVAFIILAASFLQWWDITVDGTLITRRWVKILLLICIVMLSVAFILIIRETPLTK